MPETEFWTPIPFHFWSVVFFTFGSLIGSFLNVCIHRMPREESVVFPSSHCPHCGYAIPWYLNLPLITWVYLRGKCANCAAPISFRYFLVELLTAVTFLSCWLTFGHQSALLAIVYCALLAGFIVGTFIDFEHLFIPDEITLGGIAVGFLCSFAVPVLHQAATRAQAMEKSFWGIAVGGGIVYGLVRAGKLMFGRQKFDLAPDSKVCFTETALQLPDKAIPYEEVFYRKSDTIVLEAKTVEMIDRCYQNVTLRLSPVKLRIDEEVFNPEEVLHLEAVTTQIVIPREAMGFGDVKFMAAIGAFLGWQATIFSLMASSILGSAVGVGSILLGKREWSSRIPYIPYIAAAATIWIFLPTELQGMWKANLALLGHLFTGIPATKAPGM